MCVRPVPFWWSDSHILRVIYEFKCNLQTHPPARSKMMFYGRVIFDGSTHILQTGDTCLSAGLRDGWWRVLMANKAIQSHWSDVMGKAKHKKLLHSNLGKGLLAWFCLWTNDVGNLNWLRIPSLEIWAICGSGRICSKLYSLTNSIECCVDDLDGI